MSGTGGYYKYRCKYWLTYNCANWVWVNNTPCANCLAEGRESDAALMSRPFHIPGEVYVPQLENGTLHYIIMQIDAASDTDCGWAIKEMPTQPLPTAVKLSSIGLAAIEGLDGKRQSINGFQMHEEPIWTGSSENLE